MPAATNPTRSTPVGTPGSGVDGPSGASVGGGRVSSPSATGASGGSGSGNNDVSGAANRCPIGATVKCVLRAPVGNINYEGEVLAYDPRKILILKCASTSGRNSLNNVHMINLSLSYDIQILKEKKEPLPELPSLNVDRLNNRMKDQVERKKKQVMAFKVGVSPVGQKLFQAISKTIDDVVWSGENISVLKEVTIYPPYRPEDVKGNTDSKALKHVRKIVEKHITDMQLQQQQQTPATVTPHRTSDESSQNSSKSSPSQHQRPAPSAASQHNRTNSNNSRNSSNQDLGGGSYSASAQGHHKTPYNQQKSNSRYFYTRNGNSSSGSGRRGMYASEGHPGRI